MELLGSDQDVADLDFFVFPFEGFENFLIGHGHGGGYLLEQGDELEVIADTFFEVAGRYAERISQDVIIEKRVEVPVALKERVLFDRLDDFLVARFDFSFGSLAQEDKPVPCFRFQVQETGNLAEFIPEADERLDINRLVSFAKVFRGNIFPKYGPGVVGGFIIG